MGTTLLTSAMLVEPRTIPPPSVKLTWARLLARSSAIVSVAVAKKANVGVPPAEMVVVAVTAGEVGLMQTPVDGLVSQTLSVTGSVADPVSALAVIVPVAPTLTVATAKAPLPPADAGRSSTPVSVANAIISGTGVLEADSSRVLRPLIVAAGFVLVQSKLS